MQFTHEAACTVDADWRDIWAEWTQAQSLPRLLSHVRAAAPGESGDLACLAVLLEGRQVEFVAERTMCANQTLCWQSTGALFLYVLSVRLEPQKAGVRLTLSVAYDPPGFLPDIAEALVFSRRFGHELEADLRRYAHNLELNRVSELATVD